jgi:Tol biopolymer transport system component
LGGLARRVVAAVGPDVDWRGGLASASDPSWSPDGTQLAFASDSAIFLVPADGGVPRRLVDASEPAQPRWSPDGEWLAFGSYIRPGTPGTTTSGSAIIVVRIRDGMTRTLTDRTSPNGSPVWMPDSRSLLFVSNRGGGSDIYWMRLRRDGSADGAPVRLTTGTRAQAISLSADGRQLAYDNFRWIRNVVSLEIDTLRTRVPEDARPVTRGDQLIMGMSVSPDARWLAFDSNLGGSFSRDIYRMRLPDGEPERLTDDPGDDLIPSWSPDGSQIAFYSLRDGSRDVFSMNADGGRQRKVVGGPGTEEWADWSPNGLQVAYRGEDGVYLVSKEGDQGFSAPRRLTEHTGATPVWSPDGAWIAYVAPGGGVRLVSPASGESRTLWTGPPVPAGVHPISGRVEWSKDGRAVLYRNFDGGRRWRLWWVPLSGAPPRLLLQNQSTSIGTSDVFATDGERLYLGRGHEESDIWLVTLRPQ